MKKKQNEKNLFTLSIFVLEANLIRNCFLWYQYIRILACISMKSSPYIIVDISCKAKKMDTPRRHETCFPKKQLSLKQFEHITGSEQMLEVKLSS